MQYFLGFIMATGAIFWLLMIFKLIVFIVTDFAVMVEGVIIERQEK